MEPHQGLTGLEFRREAVESIWRATMLCLGISSFPLAFPYEVTTGDPFIEICDYEGFTRSQSGLFVMAIWLVI